jgi:hypothetical protein
MVVGQARSPGSAPGGPQRQEGAVRWTQPAAAAEILGLQRSAGNTAVTAVLRARRQAPPRKLARALIVAGVSLSDRVLTDERVAAALAALENPASEEEIEGVAERLRLWARTAPPLGASNSNWSSLTAAANAVIEGLARIESGTDDDAGVNALNVSQVRGAGPVAQILLDAATGVLNIPYPHSAGTFAEGSAAVTPSEGERALSFAYFYPPKTVKTANKQTVKTTMLSVLDMSSCHFSAGELEGLLGEVAVEERKLGETRKARDREDLRPFAAALARAIGELAGSVRASAQRDAGGDLFNVKIASHSFTLVTTPGSVEVLQSFAGGGGYPLGTGITRGQRWAPADFEAVLVAALVPAAIPAVNADSRAQRALFGGSVFDDDFKWPLVELRVRKCALRSLDEIRERAAARAASNLAVYQAATAAPAASRADKTRQAKQEKKRKEALGVQSGGVKKPARTKKARKKSTRH